MRIEDAIKQAKFDNNIERVIVNIIYTYNAIRDQHMEVLKPYGLLIQHYNILRILKGKHPDAACPGEIKEVMLDKGNDVTRLIDKLVAMGLANRQLCETNRRKMDVNITEKGIKLTHELIKKMEVMGSRFSQSIADSEAIQLSNLLDKVRG